MTPHRTAQRSRPVALLTWKEWQELALLLEMLEENLDLEVREATEDDTLFGAEKNLRRTHKMSKRIQRLARTVKEQERIALAQQFVELATRLSPENLSHDGDLSAAAVKAKHGDLLRQWRKLEKQWGAPMTEDEVWQWHAHGDVPSWTEAETHHA